jgi:DNA polymerase elongation subunit (family B)
MAEYYLDIETYSPGAKPNPDTDKIISIQFQRIDISTGISRGKLTILKEWESSEEEIVKKFYKMFFSEKSSVWDFIAVGFNLNFEWEFLISKFNKYMGTKLTSKDMQYCRPHLDLKSIVVLLNHGSFKDAKLDKYTKKCQDGKCIKDFYENKQYENIEGYIKNETEAFIEFLQKIDKNIDKLVDEK